MKRHGRLAALEDVALEGVRRPKAAILTVQWDVVATLGAQKPEVPERDELLERLEDRTAVMAAIAVERGDAFLAAEIADRIVEDLLDKSTIASVADALRRYGDMAVLTGDTTCEQIVAAAADAPEALVVFCDPRRREALRVTMKTAEKTLRADARRTRRPAPAFDTIVLVDPNPIAARLAER